MKLAYLHYSKSEQNKKPDNKNAGKCQFQIGQFKPMVPQKIKWVWV